MTTFLFANPTNQLALNSIFGVCRQAVEDVINMHEMSLISPHVSANFPLEKCADALEYIRARKSTGKVVLEIR